ncbi:MAG: acyl-CoA dehydrogenase family protein [Gaiella sp.]|nr:acyl-CoA dehydrogenase family protein [Gaiella sp.]
MAATVPETTGPGAPGPYDEEHSLFREALRDFVEREVRPNVEDWERARTTPRELIRRLGELGFLGATLAPEHGGAGGDFWYTAILVEELVAAGSIGTTVSVLAHAEFAIKEIDHHGTEAQKREFLEPAVAGSKIGALAVTEPGAGSDVAALATRAVREGDELVLNGSKTFISNAGLCDFATVAARTGGPGHEGISLILVPADAPGFARGRRLEKIGTHASDTGELFFENCRVPAANILGPENGGFRLIVHGFEGERLVLALMCCRHMRVMWDEARRYGLEREAFGSPILGFQAWRHRLADALTTIEAAQALAYRAVDLYVRGEPCDKEISMAKLFAAESAIVVGRECAQIFGGYGYMEEYPIARLFRDTLAFTVGAGTSEVMREIIARRAGLLPGART